MEVCFPLTLASEDGDEGEGAHGAGLLELPSTSGHPPLTIVGSTAGFTNGTITDEDNAAIALRLLGGSPRLIWYQPGVADLAGSASDEGEDGGLLPAWLAPALALLATSLVVLALIRGRRLGRLVREPLPVVVRAVETTESRGRLYRRAQDRPRAAAVLRVATLDRLRSRLGLRRGDSSRRSPAPSQPPPAAPSARSSTSSPGLNPPMTPPSCGLPRTCPTSRRRHTAHD